MKAKKRLTLDDVRQVADVLPVGRLSVVLGWEASTLPQRLKRGSPELTEAEGKRLAEYLLSHGIVVTEDS